MRDAYGKENVPSNFDFLFALHQGLDWTDNLSRLVEATSKIKSNVEKFSPDAIQVSAILGSVVKSQLFVASSNFGVLKDDLDQRCQKCENEILVASRIENVNIRGRLIESLITADDDETHDPRPRLGELPHFAGGHGVRPVRHDWRAVSLPQAVRRQGRGDS